MLATKFFVPVTRKFQIDILKLFPYNRYSCNKTFKRSGGAKKGKPPSKCKEYEEKLVKCMSRRIDQLCSRKCSRSKSKCKVKNIVDDYQKACQGVNDRAENILKDVQNESRSMLDQLTKDIKASRKNGQSQVQKSLDEIKKMLQQLLAVDPSCGSSKRKCVMTLNHQVQKAFMNAEYDVTPQINRINDIVKNLECDVHANIERANSLLLSCRKCSNPQALAKCIEENVNYADKILDKASKGAYASLNRAEALQREILRHHDARIKRISEVYLQETKFYLDHLNNCISGARNDKKR